MPDITKTACDFSFSGWPHPSASWSAERGTWLVIDLIDEHRPRPAKKQTVPIDFERHADYLESP